MQVEVFSDVVCPWCYIGKRRLEQALESFEHSADVTVTYRSFQLDPSTPADVTGTTLDRLATKYGVSREQAKAMNDRVAAVAATVGLDFHLEIASPANTFDAHRLLHYAASKGLQIELKERLMQSYFVEGGRVADHAVLANLAAEVGLDRVAAAAVLAGDEFGDDVRSDLALARSFGATGVPFFVFDRAFAVSGAQETAVFSQVLQQAWTAAQPLAVVGAVAPGCEGDSCTV